MTIIFYDSTTCSGETISPNTWKTKLTLALKGLPYEVKQIPLHQIQQILPGEGIPASSKNADGSPFYTVPAIHDLSTGVKLSDSWQIALYLDKAYPNTHRLFPVSSVGLQRAFTDSYRTHFAAAYQFFLPGLREIFIPDAGPYFTANIEKITGKAFDQILPQGEDDVKEWEKYKLGLDKLEEWYSAENGTFLMGDTPVWADLPVMSLLLIQRRVLGAGSEKWQDVATWNGGRWGKLVSYYDDLAVA